MEHTHHNQGTDNSNINNVQPGNNNQQVNRQVFSDSSNIAEFLTKFLELDIEHDNIQPYTPKTTTSISQTLDQIFSAFEYIVAENKDLRSQLCQHDNSGSHNLDIQNSLQFDRNEACNQLLQKIKSVIQSIGESIQIADEKLVLVEGKLLRISEDKIQCSEEKVTILEDSIQFFGEKVIALEDKVRLSGEKITILEENMLFSGEKFKMTTILLNNMKKIINRIVQRLSRIKGVQASELFRELTSFQSIFEGFEIPEDQNSKTEEE